MMKILNINNVDNLLGDCVLAVVLDININDIDYGYPSNFLCWEHGAKIAVSFYRECLHDQICFLLEEGIKIPPHIISRLGLDRD